MNTRQHIIRIVFAGTLSLGHLAAMAADHMSQGAAATAPASSPVAASASASGASTSATVMAEGVIRKVDKDAKKLTIKHGEIANLQMPGMTMVFQVRNAALLDKVQVGDKVKFHAEKQDGAIVVTDVQSAQ